MVEQQLGVLVVGAGWVAGEHLEAYRNNPYTRVVAICDRLRERAAARAAECGTQAVAIYEDFEQALQHPGLDIVSICTPQHWHARQAIAAAQARKHLLIEKPAAINCDELRQLRDAVRTAEVQSLVSFVLRWNPLFQILKRIIAEGFLGTVYSVEVDYLSYNGSWWSGWNDARTIAQGVSAMLVGGIHAVDAARWFAAPGEFQTTRADEVFSLAGGLRKHTSREYNPLTHTWREDAPPMEYEGLELALIRFENGVAAKVTVNAECIMPYRFPIRIFGTQGTVMDNRLWSHKFAGQTDWVEIPTILPDSSDVRHHPFRAEIDHFVECVRTGRPSHCNLEDAVHTHEIVFAALESHKKNQPIKLPLLD